MLTNAKGTAYRFMPAVLTASGLIGACSVEYPTGSLGGAGAGQAGSSRGGSAGTPARGYSAGGSGAGGSGGSSSTPDAGATSIPLDPISCDVIKAQSRTILQTNCAGCHEAPNKNGILDFILEVDQLKSSGLLVPGSPETSRIYTRVVAGEMPPAARTQRPSNSDTTTLYQWIKVCTTPSVTPIDPPPAADAGIAVEAGGGGTTTAPFIDNVTIARWMAADITTIRLADQPFQRYLSVAHLLNAGATSAQMDLYRAALGKAINALSQGTQIVAPRSIDKYETVFRIDLRDFEWDASGTRSDKWEVLVAGNPYAIEFVDDASTIVKQLTRTKVPMQNGNWLVYGGTQAPLYNDVVGIPATLTELQRQLGTNIVRDIAQQDVARSGFSSSGVAQSNRVIERHEIPAGGNRTLWITYDFAGDGGKENVFANPLDFEPDESEIIFSLPNGLEGYMVVDAAGNRLNEASDKIVVDPAQRDGNVVNAISCIGCHDKGIKFKQDDLRVFVDRSFNFDQATKDNVDAIYTGLEGFQSLVATDSATFVQQLQRLAPSPTVTVEPVSAVFHQFDEDVDLTHAAAELGVSPNQLITQLGRLDPGLAPLVSTSIKRVVFKAAFAQTVCLLKIGLANDVACRTGP
jgi:hypothetical protein